MFYHHLILICCSPCSQPPPCTYHSAFVAEFLAHDWTHCRYCRQQNNTDPHTLDSVWSGETSEHGYLSQELFQGGHLWREHSKEDPGWNLGAHQHSLARKRRLSHHLHMLPTLIIIDENCIEEYQTFKPCITKEKTVTVFS